MKAIILAAGIGSRLGNSYPKCLNKLPYGETVLERQVRLLRKFEINEIIVVVGFKKELIMEHMHSVFYVYNPMYYLTNTSKSLLYGIENINDDIIWLNGDVVFEKEILEKVINGERKNKVVVDSKKCGDEEVKYTLDNDGTIKEISKKVKNAEGEAVGINLIHKEYLNKFKKQLKLCNDDDYFEKAIESSISRGVSFSPVYIKSNKCMEIDFPHDLEIACTIFDEK